MNQREEWSVANWVMIPVALAVEGVWIGLWVTFHEPIYLTWLLLYLVVMPLLAITPRRKPDGRTGVRSWTLLAAIGLLVLGSFISPFV